MTPLTLVPFLQPAVFIVKSLGGLVAVGLLRMMYKLGQNFLDP